VISSPPYSDSISNHTPDVIDDRPFSKKFSKMDLASRSYSRSPGNLANLKEGKFEMVVSSPPFIDSIGTKDQKFWDNHNDRQSNWHGATRKIADYGQSPGQLGLGNSSGDTFWSASREIIQQCFDLLKPSGHAIFVTKNYIKAKKIVPFSDRWLALCESVGFRLVCRHQAMLVKDHGIQTTIHGDEKITTERKSFFRRLAESKGSPRIDWEDILCLEK